MSKTNAAENAFLALIFDNVAWGTLAAVGAATDLHVSLHTADPGEAGDQTTSEAAYTGYARVAVARGAGWLVAGNAATPTADVVFGQRTDAASTTYTHFGIGTAASGAGQLLWKGQITTPAGGLLVGQNVTPRLTTATTVTED